MASITSLIVFIILSGITPIPVNIAGIATFGLPERVSRARIETIFNVNTIGTIRLTQTVLPHMKQKKAGKIIAVSSVAGKQGLPYGDIYCASKFALEGFFESLLSTIKSFNIRVCVVEPDQVNTGLLTGVCSDVNAQINDDTVDDIDRRQLRRLHEVMTEFPTIKADDVVDVLMTKCVKVENPVFRHLVVPPDVEVAIGEAVSDLTGETSISALRDLIGTS